MKTVARQFHKETKRKTMDNWLGIAALVLGGGAVIQIGYEHFFAPSGPPVFMERSEVVGDPHPGMDLVVRVWRVKVRNDCPVQSTPILINADSGAVFDVRSSVAAGGPVGDPSVDVIYPLPSEIPPGRYTLRDALAYFCPEATFLITQPDATFEVTE